MKIIHCADLHLGIERGPLDPETRMPGRVIDFLESFDYMLTIAKEEHVDAILIAGDIFHTNTPNNMILNAFAHRVQEISKICPVVILVGNHDNPGPLHRRTAVDIFGELKLDNVYLGNKFETLLIETMSGPLQVTTFPYPTRHLLSEGDLIPWDIYHSKITEKIDELRKEVQLGIPAVFLGHFTITGSKFGSERPMILGTEAEVDVLELIGWQPGDSPQPECVWDYTALGHLHYHQEVLDIPPVIYAGSLDRVDFGEEKDDKGFILVEFEKIGDEYTKYDTYRPVWKFVSVDPRPMVTIQIDSRGKKHARTYILKEISKQQVEDAIVRVTVNVDNPLDASSEEITENLYDLDAWWVRVVNIDVPRQITTRFELDKPSVSYSITELLELYLDTDDIDDEEYNKLLDLAEEIMKE